MPEAKKARAVGFNHVALEPGDIEEALSFYSRLAEDWLGKWAMNVADAAYGEAITLAFCWAHLRRKFFDIAEGGDGPIASEALHRIARLYVIVRRSGGKAPSVR
jgi:Transposase IS66 family